uniref:Plastid lipid-associated protein/fibrillin conserved domain-containing protein n=1 Tax=Mantoniella antarctica TaxID=81844 RepID=A0A7S0X983_9CHLO
MPSATACFSIPTASVNVGIGRRRQRCMTAAPRCVAAPATGVLASAPALTPEKLKNKILRLAALTDRGQLLFQQAAYAPLDKYNAAHKEEFMAAVEALVATRTPPSEMSDEPGCPVADPSLLDGDWECVMSTKQLFRSSPFFMAIQDAFGDAMFGERKSSEVFFRLHELQVKSWGASTVGRVAQRINIENGLMESYFDTILFALTVIPIFGWFKLLPTFGGRIISFAEKVTLNSRTGQLDLELVRTRVELTEGIPKPPLILPWFLNRDYPVGAVWRLLPWNKGRAPTASTFVRYVDEDFRVMADRDGEMFVYCRVEST